MHTQTTKYERSYNFIDPKNFWEWAWEHRSKIDFSSIELHTLHPEPPWMEEYQSIKRKKVYKNWSVLEEGELVHLVDNGKSMYEISCMLNRPVTAVYKKYSRIKRDSEYRT